MLKPTGRGALRLLEIAPGLTVEEMQVCTESMLEVPEHIPYLPAQRSLPVARVLTLTIPGRDGTARRRR